MLKNFCGVVVLIAVLFVVGCDEGKYLDVKEDGARLKIYRCIGARLNPYIVILAKEIKLDYDQRTIVIKGLTNFTGDDSMREGYDWVVPEINIQDNNLTISIPKDTAYDVYIGDNYHYLPIIK